MNASGNNTLAGISMYDEFGWSKTEQVCLHLCLMFPSFSFMLKLLQCTQGMVLGAFFNGYVLSQVLGIIPPADLHIRCAVSDTEHGLCCHQVASSRESSGEGWYSSFCPMQYPVLKYGTESYRIPLSTYETPGTNVDYAATRFSGGQYSSLRSSQPLRPLRRTSFIFSWRSILPAVVRIR